MRNTLIAMVLLLAGCNSTSSLPETSELKFVPDEVSPVSVYVPRFYVVTADNVVKLLSEKKVLIALSYDDSIELSKSISDINTYVLKQHEAIKVLRKNNE